MICTLELWFWEFFNRRYIGRPWPEAFVHFFVQVKAMPFKWLIVVTRSDIDKSLNFRSALNVFLNARVVQHSKTFLDVTLDKGLWIDVQKDLAATSLGGITRVPSQPRKGKGLGYCEVSRGQINNSSRKHQLWTCVKTKTQFVSNEKT